MNFVSDWIEMRRLEWQKTRGYSIIAGELIDTNSPISR